MRGERGRRLAEDSTEEVGKRNGRAGERGSKRAKKVSKRKSAILSYFQTSDRLPFFLRGVPQGSILGPVLFS